MNTRSSRLYGCACSVARSPAVGSQVAGGRFGAWCFAWCRCLISAVSGENATVFPITCSIALLLKTKPPQVDQLVPVHFSLAQN